MSTATITATESFRFKNASTTLPSTDAVVDLPIIPLEQDQTFSTLICPKAVRVKNLYKPQYNTDQKQEETTPGSHALELPAGKSGIIFFSQERVGQYGNPIVVYKIRTMDQNIKVSKEARELATTCGESGKLTNDPRVTWLGKLIRPFGLDELPQILNWLSGELKLIGHRPIPYSELVKFPDEFQVQYLKHKPALISVVYSRPVSGKAEALQVQLDYFKEYDASPYLTDVKRFAQIAYNFIFKGRRSI